MPEAIESFVKYEGPQATEIFKEPFVKNPTLAEQGIKVIPGIQNKLYLYFSSKLEKITKKRDGCGNIITGNGIAVTRRLIEVTDMNIYLEQCADIFANTIKEAALKKGVDLQNLTDTELDKFIIDTIVEGAANDYFVQMWFADEAISDPDDFYNVYDGFFVQIVAGVVGGTIANVPIAAMTTPAHAHDAIKDVWNNQPAPMKSLPAKDKPIKVDSAIYNLYVEFLSTLNGSESSYNNLVNGVQKPAYMGSPVVEMVNWTTVFTADSDLVGALGNGRIVMSVNDEALVIGLDAEGHEALVKSWFSNDDDVQKYKVQYKVGPTLKYHEMLSVVGFEVESES
jgi:hypothetical protein